MRGKPAPFRAVEEASAWADFFVRLMSSCSTGPAVRWILTDDYSPSSS